MKPVYAIAVTVFVIICVLVLVIIAACIVERLSSKKSKVKIEEAKQESKQDPILALKVREDPLEVTQDEKIILVSFGKSNRDQLESLKAKWPKAEVWTDQAMEGEKSFQRDSRWHVNTLPLAVLVAASQSKAKKTLVLTDNVSLLQPFKMGAETTLYATAEKITNDVPLFKTIGTHIPEFVPNLQYVYFTDPKIPQMAVQIIQQLQPDMKTLYSKTIHEEAVLLAFTLALKHIPYQLKTDPLAYGMNNNQIVAVIYSDFMEKYEPCELDALWKPDRPVDVDTVDFSKETMYSVDELKMARIPPHCEETKPVDNEVPT